MAGSRSALCSAALRLPSQPLAATPTQQLGRAAARAGAGGRRYQGAASARRTGRPATARPRSRHADPLAGGRQVHERTCVGACRRESGQQVAAACSCAAQTISALKRSRRSRNSWRAPPERRCASPAHSWKRGSRSGGTRMVTDDLPLKPSNATTPGGTMPRPPPWRPPQTTAASQSRALRPAERVPPPSGMGDDQQCGRTWRGAPFTRASIRTSVSETSR